MFLVSNFTTPSLPFSFTPHPVTPAVWLLQWWISIMPRSPFIVVISPQLYWNWQRFQTITAMLIDSHFLHENKKAGGRKDLRSFPSFPSTNLNTYGHNACLLFGALRLPFFHLSIQWAFFILEGLPNKCLAGISKFKECKVGLLQGFLCSGRFCFCFDIFIHLQFHFRIFQFKY